MLYICNGHPKSASSFVYQLSSGIAEAIGYDQQTLLQLYIPAKFQPFAPQPYFVTLPEGSVEQILCKLPKEIILVVKTHNRLTAELDRLLTSGDIRAVCTFRDPRDAVVSLFDASLNERKKPTNLQRVSFTKIHSRKDAIAEMNARICDVEPWLNHNAVLKFDFETVIERTFDVAVQLCRQMDVEVDSDAICKRYITNKEKIQEFNLGISGRYKTVLTTEEEGLCDDIFKPFLDRYINI